MDYNFKYLDYEYLTWDEVEEDNIKIFHYCYKGGKEIKMPDAFYNHSPYSLMSYDEFRKHCQSLEVFIQG